MLLLFSASKAAARLVFCTAQQRRQRRARDCAVHGQEGSYSIKKATLYNTTTAIRYNQQYLVAYFPPVGVYCEPWSAICVVDISLPFAPEISEHFVAFAVRSESVRRVFRRLANGDANVARIVPVKV